MISRIIGWCLRNRGMVLILGVFLIAAGWWSSREIAVDAIPDLSDVQVVIRTEYPGQAPRIVEDQVTYPLTTAMLAVPYAKVVRGYSMFGTSFVYIIFEDGTDLYWARSRVLEQLNSIAGRLPAERHAAARPGCDRRGLGLRICPDHRRRTARITQWGLARSARPALVRESGRGSVGNAADALVRQQRLSRDSTHLPAGRHAAEAAGHRPGRLRGLQDWYLRYELTAVTASARWRPSAASSSSTRWSSIR